MRNQSLGQQANFQWLVVRDYTFIILCYPWLTPKKNRDRNEGVVIPPGVGKVSCKVHIFIRSLLWFIRRIYFFLLNSQTKEDIKNKNLTKYTLWSKIWKRWRLPKRNRRRITFPDFIGSKWILGSTGVVFFLLFLFFSISNFYYKKTQWNWK